MIKGENINEEELKKIGNWNPSVNTSYNKDITVEEALDGYKRLLSTHKKYNNNYDIKIIETYLNNRNNLLNEFNKGWVFITYEGDIYKLELPKNNIDIKIEELNKFKPQGINKSGSFFHVGCENTLSGIGLYGGVVVESKPLIPISFGFYEHSKIHITEGFIDTGLDQTTINISFLNEMRKDYPDFVTYQTTINAIGSNNIVSVGKIDIIYCGKLFRNVDVWFSDIPVEILIGRDFINMGKLDYDNYTKRISFTWHN